MKIGYGRGQKAHKNFAHDPVVLCFDVYNCLVRFLCRREKMSKHGGTSRELPRTYNLKQHIASSKAVALPFLPRRDSSLCHGRGHCGHLQLGNGTVNGCCGEPWSQQVRNGLHGKVHVMAHIFVTDARQI
jgi:hypothetical protein